MADEEVPAAADELRVVVEAVGSVRNDQEVEVLVGPDQGVAHDEHVALVDALEAGDGEWAERVMAGQIGSTFVFVLEALTMSPSIQSASVSGPVKLATVPTSIRLAGRAAVESSRVAASKD